MRPALAVQAAPVVLVLVDLAPVDLGLGRAPPVGLRLEARVDLVGLMGPAALGGRPRLGPVVQVDLVVPEDLEDLGPVVPVGLADLRVPAAPVDRHRMVPVVLGRMVRVVLMGRVDLADLMDRTGLVVLDRMDPAGLAVRVGRMDLVARVAPVARAAPVVRMARVVPVVRMARVVPGDPGDPGGLNTAARAGLAVLMGLAVLDTAGLVAPAGRHRRPMCNTVTMTAVARSGVVRETHRTASAHRVTARPRLRPRTDSGGMAGPLPERRRPTGTVHRLPAVGTVRRLPEAGTHTGTDRHTTSVGGRRTMARSTTTATTPHRFSTRCSVAGASGSSVRGFRCTDLSPA